MIEFRLFKTRYILEHDFMSMMSLSDKVCKLRLNHPDFRLLGIPAVRMRRVTLMSLSKFQRAFFLKKTCFSRKNFIIKSKC